MILIISNKWDLCVDYVVDLLRKDGQEFLRINTEDLPGKKASVTLPEFSYQIATKKGTFDLTKELRSVWFRRPGKPFEFESIDNRPEEPIVRYAEDQWHSFIDGLRNIENVLWINDPNKNHEAENKIHQLKMAQQVGFNIPKTCITSSKQMAWEFYKSCNGNIIAKALYSPLIEYPDQDYFIFTTKLESFNSVPEKEFTITPTVFQELIDDKIDYRVTVIGERSFAVRIESSDKEGIPIDWRLKKEGHRFIRDELPENLERKCIGLVKRFGLVFGAIDLVKRQDEFYFLEINPNGEWFWLQEDAQLPIAETLIDYLINGVASRGTESKYETEIH